MKNAYRLFKRSNRPNYFIQDNRTGVQTSLGTADKDEAKRLLDAKNHAHQSTALNLELGKTFIAHANPEMATRTWQVAMDEMELRGGELDTKRHFLFAPFHGESVTGPSAARTIAESNFCILGNDLWQPLQSAWLLALVHRP